MWKKCARCKLEKDVSEFGIKTGARDGLNSWCRPCAMEKRREYRKRGGQRALDQERAAQRRWKKRNPERVKAQDRRRNLRAKGWSVELYERLLEEQGGGCAICGAKPNGKALSIDHCHHTGAVRGVLCGLCNRGLGYFGDDVDRLMKAINYLKRAS